MFKNICHRFILGHPSKGMKLSRRLIHVYAEIVLARRYKHGFHITINVLDVGSPAAQAASSRSVKEELRMKLPIRIYVLQCCAQICTLQLFQLLILTQHLSSLILLGYFLKNFIIQGIARLGFLSQRYLVIVPKQHNQLLYRVHVKEIWQFGLSPGLGCLLFNLLLHLSLFFRAIHYIHIRHDLTN